ncbi:UDP-N-acetylmuramoyl-L-alanine--D-glutamate ligase [Candidatus Poribacteria bacterium]|nr:UDP-N-acetylmuramoyl-L-alanine--D-glutamate ligase [Candidatus Poribacteria bacterium]
MPHLFRRTHRTILSGQQISVFGLGRSGVAITKLLISLGANILGTDNRSAEMLRPLIDNLNDFALSKGVTIDFILGGHNDDCINKADLIIVSPGVAVNKIPILRRATEKEIPILSELEVASSVCLAPIIAITGTKGKTTTAILTAEILKKGNFKRVFLAGNIGQPLSSFALGLTAEDVVVTEVSSFQLEMTSCFRPAISAILNLSPDHLDRHGSFALYQQAKNKIYANQTSDDWIILNADDPYTKSLVSSKKINARTVLFSLTDQRNDQIRLYQRDGIIYLKDHRSTKFVAEYASTNLQGQHNLANALASVSIGKICGVSIQCMRQSLQVFDTSTHLPLQHAFQQVSSINQIRFIDDSKATNVAATKAALESVPSTQKHTILIMGGYDKGNDYSPLVELIKLRVKVLILLGENTKTIRNALSQHVVTVDEPTMDLAVQKAYEHARPGDIILLSPANASFDMFSDYKARGQAFQTAINNLKKTNEN